MKSEDKMQLMDCMGRLFEQSAESNLDPSLFEKVDPDLALLSGYFGVSKSQSFIIALVFVMNCKGHAVDFDDLAKHFGCNPIRVLVFGDDFEALCSCGILVLKKSGQNRYATVSDNQYAVSIKVSEAIQKNLPMPALDQEEFVNIMELLEKFYEIGQMRDDEEISTNELVERSRQLFAANRKFPLIKRITDYNLDGIDSYLFVYVIWKTLMGKTSVDLEAATTGIFDRASSRLKYVQSMIAGKNDLLKNNLIELEEAKFFNDTEVKLTDASVEMLEEFEIRLFSNKKKAGNIIDPSTIKVKELIFSEEESRQLGFLRALLEESTFRQTQKRLTSRGLPTGIVALLHGSPGTGKTEMVLQIARETNREIMKVDISQSKSMWFGESEKIIKKIFIDYHAYAKQSKCTPILLFNEADAILSRRKQVGNSSVDQTENAIQNIILEELENFEGIFLATTNLVCNLDPAFERRFLFKVEFLKPKPAIKALIWQSKLPLLTHSECEILAAHYDFSGGQIDNIIRKSEIHEIIHGLPVNFENLVEFCEKEFLVKGDRVRIGFRND